MLLAEPIYDIRPKWQKTRTRNNNNSSNGKLEGEKKWEERRKRDETKQTKIERQTNTEGQRVLGKKKNMDDNTETLSKMANELANSKCTLRKKNEAEMKANKAKEKDVEYWQESLC